MKATGIVRNVDELGRVVLPKELRTILNIDLKDPIEIFADGQFIVLKKYNPGCSICGSMADSVRFQDKCVCRDCIGLMKAL
ncbi:MAG: AbrB/MazE/SpoVT family DNA-binding domain-containing protein [Eubacteriales bacterium]|nr:AbrB/MazE/SpoVT family DNA-binding domain-containing protein [Eubacteriales bacterium]